MEESIKCGPTASSPTPPVAHTFMFTLQNHFLPMPPHPKWHSNKVSSKLSSSHIHRIYAIHIHSTHTHDRNKRQKPIDRNCGISIGARLDAVLSYMVCWNWMLSKEWRKKRLIFFQANRVKRSQLISHVWVYMVRLGVIYVCVCVCGISGASFSSPNSVGWAVRGHWRRCRVSSISENILRKTF